MRTRRSLFGLLPALPLAAVVEPEAAATVAYTKDPAKSLEIMVRLYDGGMGYAKNALEDIVKRPEFSTLGPKVSPLLDRARSILEFETARSRRFKEIDEFWATQRFTQNSSGGGSDLLDDAGPKVFEAAPDAASGAGIRSEGEGLLLSSANRLVEDRQGDLRLDDIGVEQPGEKVLGHDMPGEGVDGGLSVPIFFSNHEFVSTAGLDNRSVDEGPAGVSAAGPNTSGGVA